MLVFQKQYLRSGHISYFEISIELNVVNSIYKESNLSLNEMDTTAVSWRLHQGLSLNYDQELLDSTDNDTPDAVRHTINKAQDGMKKYGMSITTELSK